MSRFSFVSDGFYQPFFIYLVVEKLQNCLLIDKQVSPLKIAAQMLFEQQHARFSSTDTG